MAVTKAILEKWMVEQKRHRLFDKQVQMARELGYKSGGSVQSKDWQSKHLCGKPA